MCAQHERVGMGRGREAQGTVGWGFAGEKREARAAVGLT